jgi:hypothetical protein
MERKLQVDRALALADRRIDRYWRFGFCPASAISDVSFAKAVPDSRRVFGR